MSFEGNHNVVPNFTHTLMAYTQCSSKKWGLSRLQTWNSLLWIAKCFFDPAAYRTQNYSCNKFHNRKTEEFKECNFNCCGNLRVLRCGSPRQNAEQEFWNLTNEQAKRLLEPILVSKPLRRCFFPISKVLLWTGNSQNTNVFKKWKFQSILDLDSMLHHIRM